MFEKFYNFRKGKTPGPGAEEFVYQRRWYDPHFSPIGAGVNAGSLDVIQPGVVSINQVAIVQALPGTISGQYALQSLLDPNASETV